jgi:predicted nucleic acid-binding Zn finger protein
MLPKIDYVLVDSWFTCDAFIQAVRSVKEQTIHLIGMYKIAKTKVVADVFEIDADELLGKMLTDPVAKH